MDRHYWVCSNCKSKHTHLPSVCECGEQDFLFSRNGVIKDALINLITMQSVESLDVIGRIMGLKIDHETLLNWVGRAND